MLAAFIIVMFLALVPQVTFFVLYWRWFPRWKYNSYGQLTMLGSAFHIVVLSLYLWLSLFGDYTNRYVASGIFFFAFGLLILFGVFQLVLLRRAVKAAVAEEGTSQHEPIEDAGRSDPSQTA